MGRSKKLAISPPAELHVLEPAFRLLAGGRGVCHVHLSKHLPFLGWEQIKLRLSLHLLVLKAGMHVRKRNCRHGARHMNVQEYEQKDRLFKPNYSAGYLSASCTIHGMSHHCVALCTWSISRMLPAPLTAANTSPSGLHCRAMMPPPTTPTSSSCCVFTFRSSSSPVDKLMQMASSSRLKQKPVTALAGPPYSRVMSRRHSTWRHHERKHRAVSFLQGSEGSAVVPRGSILTITLQSGRYSL